MAIAFPLIIQLKLSLYGGIGLGSINTQNWGDGGLAITIMGQMYQWGDYKLS